MDQDSNPYSEANPYMSDDMTGGSSAGGGAGAAIPKSTKPRQEPSGAKPADPVDVLTQMQQMTPPAPAGAPGMAPPTDPATAPAPPGITPAAKRDAMVRYVLKHNPRLSVKSAKLIVADADYTAPFIRPPINKGPSFGEALESNVNQAADFLQKRQDAEEAKKDPGQRIQELEQRFRSKTRNLHPASPKFQKHLNQFLNDKQVHDNAISDAFVKHQSDAFRAHRALIQNGYLTKTHYDGSPNHNYDFKHFYHNTFAHQRPHPWQHLFGAGLPHINDVRQQQAQQYGGGSWQGPSASPGQGQTPPPQQQARPHQGPQNSRQLGP